MKFRLVEDLEQNETNEEEQSKEQEETIDDKIDTIQKNISVKLT